MPINNIGIAQATVAIVTSIIIIMPRVTRPDANNCGRSRCMSRKKPNALIIVSDAEIRMPTLSVPNSPIGRVFAYASMRAIITTAAHPFRKMVPKLRL
ncbi:MULTISPECIES: hypothetical protein [unclassified Pandoraea]|uniref:hypothetical protein n=1 Tax=unclassified Pandoraea TaxID=2624094 RepID=UPI001E34A6E1|nr:MULTISPECIES: hypothetical protein [unclassified Pandoraea]